MNWKSIVYKGCTVDGRNTAALIDEHPSLYYHSHHLMRRGLSEFPVWKCLLSIVYFDSQSHPKFELNRNDTDVLLTIKYYNIGVYRRGYI